MINILLILEGNEEETLYHIAESDGFSNQFHVSYVNAEGFGNVPLLYQGYISDPYYDLVLCIYDVDGRIDEKDSPYNRVRKRLFDILQNGDRVDAASICTNPNIIQFFLLGADILENVKLTKTSKKANSDMIHKYWNAIGKQKDKLYDAGKWQLDIIENSYKYGPYCYSTLLLNAKDLPLDYKNHLPGSNLLPLLIALKNGDEEYINTLIDRQKNNQKDD